MEPKTAEHWHKALEREMGAPLAPPPREVLVDLYRCMLQIRRFEEKIVEVYGRQEMKSPVHLYIGEEAVAAGVTAHLRKEDYAFTTHRSHGHALAKGVPARELYAEFYGRVTGCCRGKGGSMHPASAEHGVLGTSAIVGGIIPIAAGAALAAKLRKEDRVAVAFFGDGAAEEGAFHESLNFAALKQLPVVFVCENNLYATNSHISARQPHPDVVRKAASYGMPGHAVDGNDVLAVYRAAGEAVDRARRGDGPSLLECKTYRWKGHVGPDADFSKGFRPEAELKEWMERCPLLRYRVWMKEQGVMTEEAMEEMLTALNRELDADLEWARNSPFPGREEVFTDIYRGEK